MAQGQEKHSEGAPQQQLNIIAKASG